MNRQASGAFGDITSLDTNNFIAVGTMQQISAAFTLSALAGNYTLSGRNGVPVRTSALGEITLASNGTQTR